MLCANDFVINSTFGDANLSVRDFAKHFMYKSASVRLQREIRCSDVALSHDVDVHTFNGISNV